MGQGGGEFWSSDLWPDRAFPRGNQTCVFREGAPKSGAGGEAGLHEWPENAIQEQAKNGIHLAHKLSTPIRIAMPMKQCRISPPCQEADYSVHNYEEAALPGPAKSALGSVTPGGKVAWRNNSARARPLERYGTSFSSWSNAG